MIVPSPWHSSHRPPLTLKLNRDGGIPSGKREWGTCEKLTDIIVKSDVGSRIRAWRTSNRGLIDVDNITHMLVSLQFFMRAIERPTVVIKGMQPLVENFVNECAFA